MAWLAIGTTSGLMAATAPTIATPPAAYPASVSGTTTQVSILGADSSGEAGLTYSWSAIGASPAAVVFTPNGTNAAKSSTATFSMVGSYTLKCVITNGAAASVVSTVPVTVTSLSSNQDILTGSNPPVIALTVQDVTGSTTMATLDASGTSFPGGGTPTYSWTIGNNPTPIAVTSRLICDLKPLAGQSIVLKVSAGANAAQRTIPVLYLNAPAVLPDPSGAGGILTGGILIVDGATVTIDGSMSWLAARLINGARVLSGASATTDVSRIAWTVSNQLYVDSSSSIDVTGLGYPAGYTWSPTGPTTTGASTYYSSGSHGGYGVDRSYGRPEVYDAFMDPNAAGAGGGTAENGPGGGLIRLVAGSLTLNGQIIADGRSTTTNAPGAGGGISLNVGAFSGTGTISAQGGTSANLGGGGGRISIAYTTGAIDLTHVTASGGAVGSPSGMGGAGSIYIKRTADAGGTLIIDGKNRSYSAGAGATPIWYGDRTTPNTVPVSWPGSIQVANCGDVIAEALVASSITLSSQSVIRSYATTTTKDAKLLLNVSGQLSVDDSSRIDATGTGYLAGYTWSPLGPTTTGASQSFNGGSHGGYGIAYNGGATRADVYDSFLDPNACGCGPGNGPNTVGAGGGLIRVTAGSLVLNGQIVADAGASASGAGGGISIMVGPFSGSGVLSARGGADTYGYSAGGGGRIALMYSTGTVDVSKFTTVGGTAGSPARYGGAGSIYVKRSADAGGLLLIDGKGSSYSTGGGSTPLWYGDRAAPIPFPSGWAGTIQISNGADVITDAITASSLSLTSSSVIRSYVTTTTKEAALLITLSGQLTIDATSSIDVSSRGYPANYTWSATGPVQTIDAGSYNGGSHGGYGGWYNTARGRAEVFDSFTDPSFGGAGGCEWGSSGVQGQGGGVIRVTAGSVVLNGKIAADGNSIRNNFAGGAGGAVSITTGSYSGSGVITANGGAAPNGAGGGGRIAVRYGSGVVNTSLFSTVSGVAPVLGGAGTVYLLNTTSGAQTLFITNKGNVSTMTTPIWFGNRTDLSDDPATFPVTLLVSGKAIADLEKQSAIRLQNGSQLDNSTVIATSLGGVALNLFNGSVLTQHPTTTTSEDSLSINLSGTLTMDAASRIDVVGKGYPAGYTWSATGPKSSGAGSSGGSHGGYGGSSSGTKQSEVYDSFLAPTLNGSGGGDLSGGGAVNLTLGALVLNGQIAADGASSSGGSGNAGGGGSIVLNVGTYSGSGLVSAKGGSATSTAGGGGRIALKYASGTVDVSKLSTASGQGTYLASAGTLYVQNTTSGAQTLVVNNQGNASPLVTPIWFGNRTDLSDDPASFPVTLSVTGGSLVDLEKQTAIQLQSGSKIDNGTVIATSLSGVTLSLVNGAVLTQHPTTTLAEDRLSMSLSGALSIDATSKIDVTGAGYPAGYTWSSTGPTTTGAAGYYSCGSHGGYGATYGGSGRTEVYDSFLDPNANGSGGGTVSGNGPGGGLIRITAGSLALSGQICADGRSTSYYAAGAGGSISIAIGAYSGSGTITAKGGAAAYASGGGGRIALKYASGTVDLSKLSAIAGVGSSAGSAGTIFLGNTTTGAQTLVISNQNNASTSLTPIWFGNRTDLSDDPATFPVTLTVTGGAIVDLEKQAAIQLQSASKIDNGTVIATSLSGVALSLINGAVLTQHPTTTLADDRLTITLAGALSIDATSRIDVTGKGYPVGYTWSPTGPTTVGASGYYSGGSHGGYGAVSGTYPHADVFDAFANPNTAGSGGGGYDVLGQGGGLVRMTVGSLTLNGQILADGGSSGSYAAGAGGGISIVTGTLTGGGLISAKGGSATTTSGGGGRIAITYTTGTVGQLGLVAAGGGILNYPSGVGGAGTIYTYRQGAAFGALIIANQGLTANQPTPIWWGDPNATSGQPKCPLNFSVTAKDGGSFVVRGDPTVFDANNNGLMTWQEYVAPSAPSLSGIETAAFAFTEKSAPQALTSAIVVTTPGNKSLTYANVAIQANYRPGEDVLSFTNTATITGIWSPSRGVLSLVGTDTPANYQAALRSVKYQDLSANPSTLVRTVTFLVNEGTTDSNLMSRTIAITTVNDAPVLATIETVPLSYVEGVSPLAITSTMTVTDADTAYLASAKIQITTNYQNGQDVLAYTAGGWITGSWSAATGTLTLTGNDTVAGYQSALRAVTYQNTSHTPNTLVRTVSFTINDGLANSTTVKRTITVTPTNDPPVVAGLESSTLTYIDGAAPLPITSSLTTSDVDNTTLAGATIQLYGYFSNQDVLAFTNTATISGAWNGTNGVLILSGTDTLAKYQAAIRSVTYSNTSHAPSAASRTLVIWVTDGAANSNQLSRSLTVTPVNDAPAIVALESTILPYRVGASPTALTSTATVVDPDNTTQTSAVVKITGNYQSNQDVLAYTQVGSIVGSWNATTGTMTLSGIDTLANYQAALRSITYRNTQTTPVTTARTVTLTINDGALNSVAVTRTIMFQVEPPVLGQFGGYYRTGVTVTATFVTAGSILRYTINGAEPIDTDPVVPTTGIVISATQIVRIRAFCAGWTPSPTSSAWYQVGPMMASGVDFTFVLSSSGALTSWGADDYGQLGDGQTVTELVPRPVPGISGVNQLATGGEHTLAVTTNGTVWSWGCNASGQLGDGTNTNRSVPAATALTGIRTIAAARSSNTSGADHSIAVTTDGLVKAWGNNSNGQLGDGTTSGSRLNPVAITGLSGIAGATAGNKFTLAWDKNGNLWSWGAHYYGALGLGSMLTSTALPVRISGISNVVQAQAGLDHVVALCADGSVWTWGTGSQGQLGIGSAVNSQYTPAVVPGLSNIVAIAAGLNQSYAVALDGTVWSWGSNANGELGDGTTTTQFSPIHVPGVANVAQLSAGSGVVALLTDGRVMSWGKNNQGQLGNGTLVRQLTAAPLNTFTFQAQAAKPVLSPVGGYYRAGVTVTASTTTTGATLRFTTTGREPALTDPVFPTGGIVVSGTQIIRVRTFATGLATSPVASAWYRVGPSVASGIDFNFALSSTGSLTSWGINTYGQLGDGQTIAVLDPRTITTISAVNQIAGGTDFALAVTANGAVWSWGGNAYSQLGDGTSTNHALPAALTPTNMRLVAANNVAANFSVAVDNNGAVWGWGTNGYGQLGDGTTTARSTPVKLPGLTNVIGITAGGSFTIAWDKDGAAWGWGQDSNLGIGPTGSSQHSSPVRLGGITDVVQIQAGNTHTIALRADGTVWTWGASGSLGQLGLGAQIYQSTPAQIPNLSGIVSIAAGLNQGYAVAADGSLWAWGSNANGEMGDGTTNNQFTPIPVPGLTNVAQVSVGSNVLVLMKDGTLASWGKNNQGQLGNGTTISQLSAGPINSFSFQPQVAKPILNPVGGYYRAGVTVKASTTTTGATIRYTTNGRDPAVTDPILPSGGIAVSGTQILRVRAFATGLAASPIACGWYRVGALVVSGADFSFALSSSGTLTAWGADDHGQLGDGQTVSAWDPRPVPGISAVNQIAGGYDHALAVTATGSAWSWGGNGYSQLGDGTTTDRTSPAAMTLPNIRMVSANRATPDFSIAVANDGSVWGWGWNWDGELGDGTITQRASPVKIAGLSNIVGITTGSRSTIAWDRDGLVWAWGNGGSGMLGNGTNESSIIPLRLGSIRNVVQVQAGLSHVVALCGDGTVWTWGYGNQGQLGLGQGTIQSMPTQVPGLSGIVAVTAGLDQGYAVSADGSLWAWGRNTNGELGDGTTTNQFIPIRVPGLTNVAQISAGTSVLVLMKDGTMASWGKNDQGQVGNGTLTTQLTSVPMAGFSLLPQVAKPLLSPLGGYYRAGVTVTASTSTTGATLRYTTNGLEPVATDPIMPGSGIVVTGTMVIRVRGFLTGMVPSQVAGVRYQTGPMVASGANFNASISLSGGVAVWGSNAKNQLGLPNAPSPLRWPTPLTALGATNHIACGVDYELAVTSDGTVWSWGGDNSWGQWGSGTSSTTVNRLVPTTIALTGMRAVAAGMCSSLAAGQNGTVQSWGLGTDGGLGNGSQTSRLVPGPVPPITNIVQVAINGGYSEVGLALDMDGMVWSWGANGYFGVMGVGQLIQNAYTPVRLGVRNIVQIQVGANHVVALNADGTVWTWGDNALGQCGTGTMGGHINYPTQVPGLSQILHIAAGGNQSFAVTRSGVLYAWGANTTGALGDGSTTNRQSPVQISGIVSVAGVSAGSQTTIAWLNDGTLWGWGANDAGQVGDGTTIPRLQPTPIGRIFRSTPQNLAIASTSMASIGLVWDRDVGAASHEIQRRVTTTGTWATIGYAHAGGASYTDRTAQSGITYDYRVRDATGDNTSRLSNLVTATLGAGAGISTLTANPGANRTTEGMWPVALDGSTSTVTSGNARGYLVAAPGNNIGETEISLVGGSGNFFIGDAVRFIGDNTDYRINDLSNQGNGRYTLSIQSGSNPGLMNAYPIGASVYNMAGMSVGTLVNAGYHGQMLVVVNSAPAAIAIGDDLHFGSYGSDGNWYRVTALTSGTGQVTATIWPLGLLRPLAANAQVSVSTEILQYDWSWVPDGVNRLPLISGKNCKRSLRGTDSDPWAYSGSTFTDTWGRPPSAYPIRLTVTDSAGKTASADMTVTITRGTGPIAKAGGPYEGGVGGPPVFFNGGQSGDDYGILDYWWDVNTSVNSDGVGGADDDHDLYGKNPMYIYTTAGTYTAKLTVVDASGQTASATTTVIVRANLAPQVSTVPFRGDPTMPHPVIAGVPTVLKARVRDAGALNGWWDFGDGTTSGSAAAITNPWAVEATHTYTGTVGTVYQATLTAIDAAGLTGQGTYLITVTADVPTARSDIAIDQGLWYLHKIKGDTGTSSGWGLHATDNFLSWNAGPLQAFCLHGSRPDGEPRSNPYVETVRNGFGFIATLLSSNTTYQSQFAPTKTTLVNGHSMADANATGIDVSAVTSLQLSPYQLGAAMDAWAATEAPLAIVQGGPSAVNGRRALDVMRDMIDMYAWGQSNYGGWRYTWNSDSDNSVCQWAAIGCRAAEEVFGLYAPQWTKDDNLGWLSYSYYPDGNTFSYSGPKLGNLSTNYGQASGPAGLVQLAWDGRSAMDPRWLAVESRVRSTWNDVEIPNVHYGIGYTTTTNFGLFYGDFSLVKALRTARPRPVALLDGVYDWYGDPAYGMRSTLVQAQTPAGSWLCTGYEAVNTSEYINPAMTSAWSLIMLSPNIFRQNTQFIPNRAPYVKAKSVTVTTDVGKPTGTVSADMINDGCIDPDGDTITFTMSPFGPYSVGATQVLFTVMDSFGLSTSTTVTVTVVDQEKPTMANLSNLTVATDAGSNRATGVNLGYPLAKDNVGVASVTNNAPAAFPLGTTTVTWTVSDTSGNATTFNQTVTVTDQEKPRIIPPNTQVVYVVSSTSSATGVTLGTPVTSDNVGVTSVTNNAPSSFPVGSTSVIWTASDAAGNQAQATQIVMVKVSPNPPVVTLSSPGDGMSFFAGSALSITAFVTNVEAGDVLKVEFYQGAVKIGEDATRPYLLSWPAVPLGTYQLTAKAILRTGGNSTNPSSVTSAVHQVNLVNAATIQGAAP